MPLFFPTTRKAWARFRVLVAIFLLTTVLAFIYLEVTLRQQTRDAAEADVHLWRTILYSELIHRRPHTDFGFRLYGMNAELLVSADIHLNNLGLISRHDFAEKKRKGEYRIVVLGGEHTASSVANRSWPDFLEGELNRRFPHRRFRVLNFGWPDAGPEHYIEYWNKEVSRFSPNLVLVNYVETDFYRTIEGAKLTHHGQDLRFGLPLVKTIDGIAFKMFVAVTQRNTGPLTLSNPDVVASRPYGIFAPGSALDNTDAIGKLQKEIVDEQIDGALPAFGSLALKHIIRHGRETLPYVPGIRNFDPPPASAIDEAALVEFGKKHFGWIQRNIPHVVILHSFHAGELGADFHLTKKMILSDPAIQVVDMRQFVPKDLSMAEIQSWYQIPHMGEKWSDKGHAAYSRLVADMLEHNRKLPDQAEK